MNETPELVRFYDDYYACSDYQRRYPAPNPATLDFLRECGMDGASEVLDLGCGNGRYAVPLLAMGKGRVTGCDPSREALVAFGRALERTPWRDRVRLVHGPVDALDPDARFDGFLLLFGVLGLLGPSRERLRVLRRLRSQATPDARLVLTVPSIWRRLPGAQLRAWYHGLWPAPDERTGEPQDVRFVRRVAGRPRAFTYHLYRAPELRRELAEGGWQLLRLEAESVLPESFICRRPALARWDARLRPWWPAPLGYGMRALAVPA